MKLGVKAYHEEEFLDEFIGKADFFETQAIQKYNYDFLKKYKKLKIPIVIHAEHAGFSVNLADKTKEKKNLQSINYAIKLANIANSKKIIVHPGHILNKNCSKEQSIKLLKKIKDKRILIENLTFHENRFCQTPEQTKEFLKQTNKDFIFDLGHAIININHYKLPLTKTIKDFIKLKPKHFHISGLDLKSVVDQHESFKSVNLPLKKFLKLYPKNAEITLEVTKDLKKTQDDLNHVKKIIKEL